MDLHREAYFRNLPSVPATGLMDGQQEDLLDGRIRLLKRYWGPGRFVRYKKERSTSTFHLILCKKGAKERAGSIQIQIPLQMNVMRGRVSPD